MPMTQAGPAIRVMRQSAGITLRDLAERAHTTIGYLSRVERGERLPSDEWMLAVTAALGQMLADKGRAA